MRRDENGGQLEELERDLRDIARPNASHEAFRVTLRERLLRQAEELQPAGATSTRPARSLFARRRIPILLTAAGAVAAMVCALLLWSAGTSVTSAQAAILLSVRHAITPPAHVILHMKLIGSDRGVQVGSESWQLTSPPYSTLFLKGPIGHQSVSATNGRTEYTYDPASNTIFERPLTQPQAFADPISQVRAGLADGQARLVRSLTIDGVPAYEIALAHGLVGYFAKATYRPLAISDPQSNGRVVELRVTAYRYLADTAANRRLLSLTALHPAAAIDRNPRDWPGDK